MIRKFRENDLPSIMQIWFDSNVEVHSFIPEKYWMDNFEMVKDILPQAEIYVYENLGKIKWLYRIKQRLYRRNFC